MRAGLEPEPNSDRRASGRKPGAAPAGGLVSGARASLGARGGGTSLALARFGDVGAAGTCVFLHLCTFVGPARRKWWRSRFFVFFFFPPLHPLPPTGLGFLAVSEVSGNLCGKLMVCEVKTRALFSP